MITRLELAKWLSYNPQSGIFIWKEKRGNAAAGSIAGTRAEGRIKIRVCGEQRQASHLAWLFTYGKYPKYEIDHIDGNPLNNSINNLRDVPHNVNIQNTRTAQKNSVSGLLGSSYHQRDKVWIAQIAVNGKTIYLGGFKTAEEAHLMYVKAKRELHVGCTI